MTSQRVILLSIAMITVGISSIVFGISQVSGVFADIQCQWGRKFMDLFITIFPFAAMVGIFVINVHAVFLILPATKARKFVVQTVGYVSYRGTFVPFVVPPTQYQARLFSEWMFVIFSLKMCLAVNRDHRQQQNASLTYFRCISASITCSTLLMLLTANATWMCGLITIYRTFEPSPVDYLYFFEPLSIAFETLHAILVHGFQLIDIWLHHSPRHTTNSIISDLLDMALGLLWGRKRAILRDVGFLLDIMSLLMSVGHYVNIWKLHERTFNLFAAMLFLHIISLLNEVVKRTRKFITL